MHHQNEQLQLIIENTRDFAIVLFDTQRRITLWNVGAERVLGWTETEIVGQLADVFFTSEDRQQGAPEQECETAREQGRAEDERWHLRKDGSLFWGSGLVQPVYEAGQLRGYVKIFRDLTQRKQAEEQHEYHLQEVKALNARLSRAIQETHHRVKNNLQVIASLLEMEEERSADGAHLQRIKQHTQTLAMIHDILTMQAKEEASATLYVGAETVLGKLLPMLQQASGGRSLRAEIEDVPLSAQKSAALALLVNEGVSNAIKHGAGEVEITLRFGEQRSPEQERRGVRRARLEVSDDGPGFPPDFDPRQAANTGLELIESAARWDLRGEVVYENREQGGARIVVTFPIGVETAE